MFVPIERRTPLGLQWQDKLHLLIKNIDLFLFKQIVNILIFMFLILLYCKLLIQFAIFYIILINVAFSRNL